MGTRSKAPKRELLEKCCTKYPLRGLRRRQERTAFLDKVAESLKKLRALRMRKFRGSVNPSRKDFHPLAAVTKRFEEGDHDEAIWLAFLCTHFGQDVPETVRLFYGKFGTGLWTWKGLAENPGEVASWIQQNARKLSMLKFGNHRKYEARTAIFTTMESFVEWVRAHGDESPFEAFHSLIAGATTKGEAFDSLFRHLTVHRFGRTGKFDLLCLLGNLGILPIEPDHCYLAGAGGPKSGAILLVTGKRNGKLSPAIEATVKDLQNCLAVPAEAMEDALCNWQKRKGFLSTTCGFGATE